MHSHHSHSGQFCKHANSTLDEIVTLAKDLGFTHFHLSEHCPRDRSEDLYPEEVEAGLSPQLLRDAFVHYLEKARSIQADERASGGLHMLVGCETENIHSPHSITYLETVFRDIAPAADDLPPPYVGVGAVDYMVGSVHHVHGVPIDFDKSTFEKALSVVGGGDRSYQSLASAYLDLQYEVLERLRPEVIGHTDLYRLFVPQAEWYSDAVLAKLDRNIRFAASYGALFEANSAAFRKGWQGETYPGRQVLQRIRAAGGRIALSDDSHGTNQVALNYSRLREYLLSEGVHEIWYLEADDTTWPTDSAARRAQYASDEAAREARLALDSPGSAPDAPQRFPRGARAVPMTNWSVAPFWRSVAERCTP
ncbi:histidinol-phosphatase [Malassezia cuniculi]|uniref:Histidinol-phosphatase n=1 Tax=Malassezia cuniculi TaxID=948313 RepID=A0AAF0J5G3_9BASI|nr:histidinol-phosphatase [Malassezia cuniculi]